MTVNIHEAKSSLSKLIAASEKGEEVVIARAGKPVVYLKPVNSEPKVRVPGRFKGQLKMSDEAILSPTLNEEEIREMEENLCKPY